MAEYKQAIQKYLPSDAIDTVINWIYVYNFQLKITRERVTKLGDYRPPIGDSYHRISVNHNLNKYSFLITLVHEIAHLIVWRNHNNRVRPHGVEWKNEFRTLMGNFENKNIFPEDIANTLKEYLLKPHASSCANMKLSRVLINYDDKNNLDDVLLEDILENSLFRTKNGRTYKKQEKLRKRFKCICLNNNKLYLVHPMAKVIPVDK